MAKYPDWAPKKRKSANLWEPEEESAPEVREEPKKAERPVRECPTCHVPMQLWESDGHLLYYQAVSKTMPNLAGAPHYHEADLYLCTGCGRYDFFRPVGEPTVEARFEAFKRCSDQQLRSIVKDKLRSEEMRQAAQAVLDSRGQEQ